MYILTQIKELVTQSRSAIHERKCGVALLPTLFASRLQNIGRTLIYGAGLLAVEVKLFVSLKRYEIEKARKAISDYDSPEFLERIDEWEVREFFEPL